ncbi:branched-chain amino acid transport system permease protein [Thermanaeromonas toyohensis ToBE]|uniref:Branched-chain amino acid transport system permease protein n=1 Tax=Thermanaeromonas toyohensis ToBE TaxID=698762 RepID=A0A1W1VFZ2_9FIRM|nr:branched-chain amino acid ABC transporter permease [Thermanaeromonas toyohensis]SMB92272.1 branched-chain amino acid transport system permease protein [Thermanaeromonas toyohensis ToBE]
MDWVIQVLAGGMAIGLLYSLPALAIVLLWNTAGFFNLAQGDFMALSAYCLLLFYMTLRLPFIISALFTILVLAIVGFVVDKILFYPLRKFRAQELLTLIATVGLSVFMKNLIRATWGTKPLSITNVFGTNPLKIMGAYIMPHVLWIMGVSILLIIVLYYLSQKSLLGIAMRAAAEDKEAAQLMGIKVNTMIGLSFAISLAITAVAGILSSPILYLVPEMGDSIGLKAFAATVIGGFGNPAGAVFGGVILGLVETLVGMFLTSSYKNAITFAVLIGFLLFKPDGLFALRTSEKV